MKKLFLSLIVGILLGALTTTLFFDYQTPWTSFTYSGTDSFSEPLITKAMDIDFLFYATIFSIVSTIVVYFIWTYIENKQYKKFLEEFHNNKEN